MSERYERCRYWPDCELHLGDPKPRYFSTRNVAEMRGLRRRGETLAEIAPQFDTWPSTVGELTRRRRSA